MVRSQSQDGTAARGSDGGNGELREFLLVVRRALLMICKYIEKRYDLTD